MDTTFSPFFETLVTPFRFLQFYNRKAAVMKPLKSILIITTLVFAIVGCGDDNGGVAKSSGVSESYEPEVRLVKDGPHDFHFQWDEPLNEERIILCLSEEFVQLVDADNDIGGHTRTGFPEQRLVYFPQGSFRSKLFTDTLVFIEILSAHQRSAFPLPSYARDATADFPENIRRLAGENLSYLHYHGIAGESDAYQQILREHPFKPYRVGKPSRLTFTIPE